MEKEQTEKKTNKEPELNAQRLKFCHEYIIDLNQKQAAIRAGYSEKSATSQGSRLLTFVNVRKKIQELKDELSKKTDITKEEVLNEIKIILRSDISDYVDYDGKNIKFKSFKDLSKPQLKAIESIKQTAHGIELKLHGKTWSIERVCKMLGYDAATEIDLSMEGFSGLMSRVRSRKNKNG